MRRFFDIYQYLGPALLTPAAAYLWWRHYDGNWHLVAVALLVPILHAYVVPGIGTNVLGMWSFSVNHKIGSFRPQHGFLFGSATAVLVLPFFGTPLRTVSLAEAALSAVAAGGALLIVNWVYDALAIRHGILHVYNERWHRGDGPWSIAGDYVFWFFGLFGVIYGASLRLAEPLLLSDPALATTAAVVAILSAACMLGPVLGYVGTSYLRYGHSGCRPFGRQGEQLTR